jgi:hypothetical protein
MPNRDAGEQWANEIGGADGGSCLELTIPTIIHQAGAGEIFAGGGGGVGGNGYGCYFQNELDDPTPATFPGTTKDDPISAADKTHMAGTDGGAWGESGGVGWFTAVRQTNIYGAPKYAPGAGGYSIVKNNGVPVSFTPGSDDAAVFKGSILELPL